MRTAKHDLMRNVNTLGILECIRDFGPLTKREIQKKTGLSWGAVSNITNELLKKRVLSEFKSTDSTIGRTPAKLDISTTDQLFVGVDINIEGLSAVLIDLKCRVLNSVRAGILRNEREEVLGQVKDIIRHLIDASGVSLHKIIGIGVAMQGSVDAEKGISVYSPHFSDWMNVPLKDILEEEFGIPTCVEHDPNCMALTERWLGYARNIQNMLFIRLSMGIGMSIIINGEIYRGVDGSAGEFGHITMNPNGARCSCGNCGCLEVYASGRSILQQVRKEVKLGRITLASKLGGSGDITDLSLAVMAARQGNERIKEIFENAGIYLGIGISNLINIFNPEMIIIGGELAKYGDLFLGKIKEIVEQKAWRNSRVNIVCSQFGSDSAAIGAAAVFVQKVFTGEIHRILK